MNRPLPFDVCRCLGHVATGKGGADCERRENCRRYLDRKTGGPRTPTSDHLCNPDGTRGWANYLPVSEQA